MALTKKQINLINDALKDFDVKGLKLKNTDIIKKIDEADASSFIDFYKDMVKDLVKSTNSNIKNGIKYDDVNYKFDTLMTKLYKVKFNEVEQKPFDKDEYEDFLDDLFKENPILLSDDVSYKAEKQSDSMSKGDKLIARVKQSYLEIDAYLDRDISFHQKENNNKIGMFGIKKSNKLSNPKDDLLKSILEQTAPAYKALKDEYNSRGFFGKWFTFEGYRMRNAISECEDKLSMYNDKLGNPIKDEMSSVLDNKALELKDYQEEANAKNCFRRNIVISSFELDDDDASSIMPSEDDDLVSEYEIIDEVSM